jgi:glucosamine--fructose-6-phosphate aminotransferase (isomerizing)
MPRMMQEAASIPERAALALSRHQPEFETVAAAIRDFAPLHLVTVARGSSDHAAEYAGRLAAQHLGLIPASLPPSLVTLAEAPLRAERALVLAISQSGRSPDLLATVAALRGAGALTVALVNDGQSPLATTAELALPVDAGPERAVAATVSFVLSLLQAARLLAAVAEDDLFLADAAGLPALLAQALAVEWSPVVPWFAEAPSCMVAARGPLHAIAREGGLKLKEAAGLHAEALSLAELMHGPKALLTAHYPLLALADAALVNREMLQEVAGLTGRLVVAGPAALAGAAHVALPAAPRPDLQALVTATALLPLVAAVARARGVSPDAPRHLTKVTETM